MAGRGTNQQLNEPRTDYGPGRTRPRAADLAPQERRAAIIEATVELLASHGTDVTTRQIAEAAAVAEGTIFRVFPDKESLIAAAIEQAFDPAPVEAELLAIDATLSLEMRLEAAVDVLQSRFTSIWRLMSAVGRTKVHDNHHDPSDRRGPQTLGALATVFEPDRERLSRDPMVAAQLLRGLIFAGTHPALLVDEPISAPEIVGVFLDGILARPGQSC